MQTLSNEPTNLAQISYQIVPSETFSSIMSKNLRKHLVTDFNLDQKSEGVCMVVKNLGVQVESEREDEFIKQIFESIGVDNMKVLQSGGRQLRILILFKNPKETEIWYTYGNFIDHNTCKNITKFF